MRETATMATTIPWREIPSIALLIADCRRRALHRLFRNLVGDGRTARAPKQRRPSRGRLRISFQSRAVGWREIYNVCPSLHNDVLFPGTFFFNNHINHSTHTKREETSQIFFIGFKNAFHDNNID
jgi:hypothetical protein